MSNQWIIYLIIIIALILIIGAIFSLRRKKGSHGGDQVYVGNLPYRINEFDLKNHFGKYGRIKELRIVKNSKTGHSRGYGFVTFATAKEAQDSLVENGELFKGRKMVVRIAKPPK